MTDRRTELFDSTSKAMLRLMHIGWGLKALAGDLGRVGLDRLADEVSLLAADLSVAHQTIRDNSAEEINLELKRSTEATNNMVLAAVSALSVKAQ